MAVPLPRYLAVHRRRLAAQQAIKAALAGWAARSETVRATAETIATHFSPIADQFDCMHIPHFIIENVSVRRRQISGGLKGDWYIGDIASTAYKRRINYERINHASTMKLIPAARNPSGSGGRRHAVL